MSSNGTRPKRPRRSDPVKHKDQVRRANVARYRAMQILIKNHQAEFDELYLAQARLEGVTPKPRHTNREQIRMEIERLQAQLARVDSPPTNGKHPAKRSTTMDDMQDKTWCVVVTLTDGTQHAVVSDQLTADADAAGIKGQLDMRAIGYQSVGTAALNPDTVDAVVWLDLLTFGQWLVPYTEEDGHVVEGGDSDG